MPRLAAAVVWLVLGWLVAGAVKFFLSRLLLRLGLDGLSARMGAAKLLEDSGLSASPSRLIARLIYWLVLGFFLLAAIESLGMSRVVDTLGGLVGYLPNVLAAALILLFGGLLARFIGDAFAGVTSRSGLAGGPMLGQVVSFTLFVFVGILALEQLQVHTTLLTMTAVAIVVSIALTLSLSFGIGSRYLAHNIMSGFHARESFNEGALLSVRGHRGKVISIGSVKTLIETESGVVSIPNSVLTDEEVTIIGEVGAAQDEE